MVTEVTAAMPLQTSVRLSSSTHADAAATFANTYADAARNRAAPNEPVEGGLRTLLEPLLGLNDRSAALVSELSPVDGGEMRPGQLMMVSMRSHEFLFHCELVANVANRSADGMQQLFRQQS